MPALAQQLVQFDWSGARQDKNDRKIQPGELVELKNVRYPKDGGSPEKRYGHDKATVSAFSGGTYAGPATELLPAPTPIWRDSASQLWAKDGTTGYYRGLDLRALPTWYELQNRADYGGAHKPVAALANGDLYDFTLGVAVGGGTGYQVTVLDPLTGVVKLETAKVAANGIIACAACADANGVAWFFYADASGNIFAHKFNGPTATPVITTYTAHGGEAFVDLDARLLTATGQVVVVAVSAPGGGAGNYSHFHSYLDTSTGQAKTSPAGVLTAFAGPGVGGPICGGGISVVNEDGSSGVVRYSFWRAKDTTHVQLMRVKADASTLAILTTVELFSTTGTGDLVAVPASGGWIDGTNEDYLSSVVETNASGALVAEASSLVRLHVFNGTSTTTTVVQRSAILASRPFKVGGAWYFLSGFDDGPTTRAQRGFFVQRVDGALVTSVLDGAGAAAFFAGGLIGSSDGSYNFNQLGSGHMVTPLALDATTVLFPLLQEGFTRSTPAPTVASVDFAATWHSDAQNISVGGIPRYVSPQDVVSELAPIHFPYEDAIVTDDLAGTAIDPVNWTWRYATIHSDGRITRSAPMATVGPTVFHTFVSVQRSLALPTLRHTIGPTWIELYGTVPGGVDIFLQQQIPNDPTVDTITVVVFPENWSDTGELLDTTGGALPATSIPPAYLSAEGIGRAWLVTVEGEIWHSRERIPGHGWEFNPALVVSDWADGTGPITAICRLADDAMAVFREDAVGIIQGFGPDGNAQGTGYRVATITTKKGVTNPAAVTVGPLGVYFQNAADGRMCLLSGGVITEISQGQDNYRAYVPTAAVEVAGERAIRLPCANGKQMVLDYSKPLPDQQAGTWILYEGATLPAAVGMRLIAGAPVLLEAGTSSAASFWTPNSGNDDNGTVCLTDWTTGRLQPVGLMGEFDVDEAHLSSTHRGGDSTYTYTLTSDQGTTEDHPDVASDVADVAFRSAVFRTRDVRLRVRETSATGAGRVFDGVAMIVRPYGRLQNPYRKVA